MTDKTSAAAISAELTALGGQAETHELDDSAVAEVDAASMAAPADASVNDDRMTRSVDGV